MCIIASMFLKALLTVGRTMQPHQQHTSRDKISTEREMRGGRRRAESPDGTVKRMHNGNTTLLSFNQLMQAYAAVLLLIFYNVRCRQRWPSRDDGRAGNICTTVANISKAALTQILCPYLISYLFYLSVTHTCRCFVIHNQTSDDCRRQPHEWVNCTGAASLPDNYFRFGLEASDTAHSLDIPLCITVCYSNNRKKQNKTQEQTCNAGCNFPALFALK